MLLCWFYMILGYIIYIYILEKMPQKATLIYCLIIYIYNIYLTFAHKEKQN